MPDIDIRSPRDIADTIRRQRKKLGMTQSALAAQAGVETKHISRLETSVIEPRLSTLLAVLGPLGLALKVGDRTALGATCAEIEDIF